MHSDCAAGSTGDRDAAAKAEGAAAQQERRSRMERAGDAPAVISCTSTIDGQRRPIYSAEKRVNLKQRSIEMPEGQFTSA